MDPHGILTHLGLTDKEIQVYMACLEFGTAPISTIAKRAKLKRANTYMIMEKLLQKGIAERFVKNHTRNFGVISPTALYEKYELHLKQLQNALPQMMAQYNTLSTKPTITFYEGKDDLKKLYLDVLNTKSHEALNYFLPDTPFDYFGEEWVRKQHIAERVKRGVRLRVLMPKSRWSADYQARSPKELREIRMMTREDMHFTNEVYIYDDKMSVFSFDEDFAILIESKDVVSAQRIMFELAWESRLVEIP